MTTRDRFITTAAAKAHNTIQREAEMNGEQVSEATREAVRSAVVDAAGRDPRGERFNAPRAIAAIVRRVEDFADVKRGWWS